MAYNKNDVLFKNNVNMDEIYKINLCVYKINSSSKFPFLEFLLSTNGYDSLSFPILPKTTIVKDRLTSYSMLFLSGILQTCNFDKIIFDGFYEYNKNLYMFYNVTNCDINID